MDNKITGRRPNRSDNAPSTGADTNCIAAQQVPKRKMAWAVRPALPPMKSTTNRGSTGTMMPKANTSSATVTKTKANAAERRAGTIGPDGSDAVMGLDGVRNRMSNA